nr:hypothetical protein [Tanacetum cinerariifolium]
MPTVDEVDTMILQDTLQVSLVEHKSREDQEARENVELEHLASVEIEKMVEGQENVIDDSSISKNDEHNSLETRLEPKSDKESLEVEFTDVVILVNVNEEEEEIIDEVYELKRKEKGKIVEESRNKPFPTPIRSPRIYTDLVSSNTKKLQELTIIDNKSTPSSSSPSTNTPRTQYSAAGQFGGVTIYTDLVSSDTEKLQELTVTDTKSTPSSNDPQLQQQDIAIWLALQMKFGILQVPQTACRTSTIRPRDQDDPHDDAHPEEENSAKWQKTSEYEAYVSGESSSGQDNEKEQGPSTLVQICQRDPEAPALSLINQDLLYLKKGSSGPEKIMLSLHKFPVVIFNDDDDIKERTFRWVNKYVNKFNPYARYGVEH